MFVQHHGWFIKGLEPDGDTRDDAPAALEWIPSYLQNILEKRLGTHGMNLKELATLAATLESLIHKEAGEKLKVSYNAHGFSPDASLTVEQVDKVLSSYMIGFLEPPDDSLDNTTKRLMMIDDFKA